MMPSADHAQRVLSSLNQQRAAGKFCDAVLNLGDGVIHVAHRSILACFSEIFQQGNTATSSDTELCLQQCPKDGLEVLLNFVYTGELKLDPDNLDQVQNAAASLCIPEALALCQKFKETSAHALIIKRKRGRPRKSKADMEDNMAIALTKEESSSDTASCCTAATTTTRSGRVVKGPKRLVTDESSVAYEAPPPPLDKESGDGETRISDQPTGDTKSVEPLVDIIDNVVSSKVSEEVEEDDFEKLTEDSDEEYVPVDNSSSSAPSTSAARRRKTQRKPGQDANDETVEDDDPNKESVQCPICFKSFKSKYYLKVHNRRHTGDRPFACNKCGKRYFRKENLLIHELKNCEKTQSFTCQTCSTTFNGKEELRNHAITHLEDMPYKCSTCPEQFMYKKNLTFHMMKIHGYPKPHACPQCPKTFLTRTELRVHEAAKHRGEKPFVCEECGHRASSRNGLQMHIKAIHRNERPFVCNLCGHAFSQKNNLKMHQRVHSGEKPYQCHYCGKTFRTQASLYKHHRTHTGERPFSCDVCEQRFTEKGALVRHKASKHEEGRPHCCHICNKTFKAKEQLRVHLRRHKGMRKFECIDCGYKFTRQAHLRRHIQIHKRTENYNPRQRKLRNVIVQEVDESSAENELVDASLMTEETEYNTETVAVAAAVAQQSANLQPDSVTGLAPSCIVRVVIESSDAAMEEAASNQNVAHMEAVDSFTVPEVLQQTQLVTKAYEPTLEMEGIMENETENNT